MPPKKPSDTDRPMVTGRRLELGRRSAEGSNFRGFPKAAAVAELRWNIETNPQAETQMKIYENEAPILDEVIFDDFWRLSIFLSR